MQTSTYPVIFEGTHSYIDTAPDSDERPVLLLHGMLGNVTNWESTIRELALRDIRVVVPLLPIYSIAKQRANMDGLVSYLDDFFKDVEIPPCTIAGNSMGGQLAVLFTVANPHLVERLVLSGASGITEVDLGSSIMRRKDRAYLRNRIEKTFFEPVHCSDELVEVVIEIINARENVVRLISFARSVQREGIAPVLTDIRVPTLIIWGQNDQITPVSVAHTLNKGIPGSSLVILQECGHAPMMERPGQFNDALMRFLAETEAAVAQPLVG